MIKKSVVVLIICSLLGGCNIQQRMGAMMHHDPAPIEHKGDLFYGKQSVSRIVQVEEGDTLMNIAETYGVPFRDLVKINNLSRPYNLKVGQSLKIPTERYHVVRAGDTVTSIAQKYNINRGYLAAVNHIKKPYFLNIGDRVRIPHRESVFLVAEIEAGDGITTKPVASQTASKVESKAPVLNKSLADARSSITKKKAAKPAIFKIANPLGKKDFEWPVKSGKVLARFSSKNEGMNISAVNNSSVMAAADGEVIYVGSDLKNYGKLIIIKHDKNIMTAYAHNSKILVAKGQKVIAGQIISRVGATGEVESPQLYFSMRHGAKTVDPEKVL